MFSPDCWTHAWNVEGCDVRPLGASPEFDIGCSEARSQAQENNQSENRNHHKKNFYYECKET